MEPSIIVIFGITGDLSKRKLLPALYHLLSENLLSPDIKIIGVSRHDIDIDELLGSVELCVLDKDNVCNPEGIQKLRSALESFRLDPTVSDDFDRLKTRLSELDNGTARDHLFYMSIPPSAYAPIIEQLATHDMNGVNCRLLLEKPFGYDLESAGELIDLIESRFKEQQVYRTDHYLAKETAQNLLSFRLYNGIFASLWNAEHIESVTIRAIEKISIEGRAEFYEKTGALRDLIQSHLMQLLALTLMDLPNDLSSEQIHRSKQYFLEQLCPADPARASRGQYEGYKNEVNNPSSSVETFARLRLEHTAERWQGVEMVLETGKSMAAKETSITIVFKTTHDHPSNNLRFEIQPNEGIALDLLVKNPGLDNTMRHTSLDFDYQKSFTDSQHIDAYERVLIDALNGDQALFASASEVLATWRVLQPVQASWKAGSEGLVLYPPGSEPAIIN